MAEMALTTARSSDAPSSTAVQTAMDARLSFGWWGLIGTILTEAALFAYLLFSYFYLQSQSHNPWPPGGAPALTIALPNTFILVLSSIAMWWGERGIRQGRTRQLLLGTGGAFVLGSIFVGLQGLEWSHRTFTPASHAYGSLYFTITGFHMVHVAVGLIMLAAIFVWAAMGFFNRGRFLRVSLAAIYWHFVDVVWLAVFTTFYITPHFF